MARVASIKTLRNSYHGDEGTASIVHFSSLPHKNVTVIGRMLCFSRKIIAEWTTIPYGAENASEMKCGKGKTEQEAVGGRGKEKRSGG